MALQMKSLISKWFSVLHCVEGLIWCGIRGYPINEKWGPANELKNGRGRGSGFRKRGRRNRVGSGGFSVFFPFSSGFKSTFHFIFRKKRGDTEFARPLLRNPEWMGESLIYLPSWRAFLLTVERSCLQSFEVLRHPRCGAVCKKLTSIVGAKKLQL